MSKNRTRSLMLILERVDDLGLDEEKARLVKFMVELAYESGEFFGKSGLLQAMNERILED